MAKKTQDATRNDFESWNQDVDTWTAWIDKYYDKELVISYGRKRHDPRGIKAFVKSKAQQTQVKRICFDNMMLRGDWAAIHYHYRVVEEDQATNEKTAGSVMQSCTLQRWEDK